MGRWTDNGGEANSLVFPVSGGEKIHKILREKLMAFNGIYPKCREATLDIGSKRRVC